MSVQQWEASEIGPKERISFLMFLFFLLKLQGAIFSATKATSKKLRRGRTESELHQILICKFHMREKLESIMQIWLTLRSRLWEEKTTISKNSHIARIAKVLNPFFWLPNSFQRGLAYTRAQEPKSFKWIHYHHHQIKSLSLASI